MIHFFSRNGSFNDNDNDNQVNTSQDQVTCVMATQFILIPKHKYDQLQKDASRTVKDLPITTPSTNITSATTSDVK